MMKIFSYAGITAPNNFKFRITHDTLTVNHFAFHRHEFSELVIILGGTAIHLTDKGEYPIAAGDVFVLNADMAHGLMTVRG